MMSYKTSIFFLLLIFFFASIPILGITDPPKDVLAPDERAWLSLHSGKIRFGPSPNYAPIGFVDKKGNYKGITADYVYLLEKKLNFKFKMIFCETWNEIIQKAKKTELDVIGNILNTPERREFLQFTQPYITIPNVIIVRKEFTGELSLKQMQGMKVAVVQNYATVDYIQNHHKQIIVEEVIDNPEGLKVVSFGRSDAFITDLSVASYCINQLGINNLRVAGTINFSWHHSFASRKDWPTLNHILMKGLALITQDEKDAIYRKWISLDFGYRPFYESKHFWIIFVSIFGFTAIIIFAILFWNRSLKREVTMRTENLNATNIQLKNEIKVREKVEAELRSSQQFSETVLNSSPNIIYVYDIEKKITIYSNEGINRVLGYSVTEIKNMGKRMIETLMHPDDFNLYISETLPKYQSVEDNDLIEHEYRMKHRDGHWCWLFSKESIFLRNEDHSPKQIFGIISDISKRKKAENALNHEKEKAEQYLELAGVMFIGLDIGGHINVANKKSCDILGYVQNEIMGLNWFDHFIPPEIRDEVRSVFQQLIKGDIDPVEYYENEVLTKTGTIIHAAWHNTIIKNEHNQITGIISSGEDITDKKRQESQILQQQKLEAIGTLAGGIAHDFNNMLGIITGNISYALGSLNEEDELYEILSDIQATSKQAQGLTHQLLTFSKGGSPIKKVSNINKIIRDAAIFSIRGASSKCNFILPDDLWTAEVDEGQINQVVNNLVINANQAMPNGGMITIRTENISIETQSGIPLPAGKYVKIIFEDQGVGIPKSHLTNIFEPYFTTKPKGNGLGLAMTYSIIKRHNGHIAVYSEVEKGTVFNIYLPASQSDFKSPEEQKESKHKGQGKILIMDDQEAILKMVGRMLKSMGYQTSFAIDGSQAVKIYKETHKTEDAFDAVILDLTVPGGMGGMKTVTELLKIDSNVKAIVSSGYSNDPVMSNYKDYGFCGVVPKPYTKAQLAEILYKILDEKK